MHTRCWMNCIGCRWSSASAISWPCWRSRYGIRQHRRISVGTSEHAVALGHCGHQPFHCSMCHSDRWRTHWHRQTILQLWSTCNLEFSAFCCCQQTVTEIAVDQSFNSTQLISESTWKATCTLKYFAQLELNMMFLLRWIKRMWMKWTQ